MLSKIFLVVSIFISMSSRAHVVYPYETGGSNYVVFDLGDFLKDGSLWGDPKRGVKMVIARYHENPEQIKKDIKAIADSGQKKLALMIWYVNYPEAPNNVHMHTINVSNGFSTQHRENFFNYIAEVKKYNFDTLTIRVAAQGGQDVGEWQTWNESDYQIQWAFIKEVVTLTNNALKNSSIRPMFDLGNETGGLTRKFQRQFVQRVWTDYVNTFGNTNTVSVSIAYAYGRLSNLLEDLDRTGKGRPEYIAIDMYGDMEDGLYGLSREVESLGIKKQKIILQEVYYNDIKTQNAIRMARCEWGLNIVTSYQWNLQRGWSGAHFSIRDPSQYNNYLTPMGCD